MASTAGQNTVNIVKKLAAPVLQQQGLSLWDLRFEKEGIDWCLTFFIDKEGGVDLNDCENFSRAMSDILDEADPIEQSYYLQVFSPGVQRKLTRPEHFAECMGENVLVKLIRPLNGQREYAGKLQQYENNEVTILTEDGEEIRFLYKQAAYIKLDNEVDLGGSDSE